MKMKRFLALLLAVAMVFSLTACGKKAEEKGEPDHLIFYMVGAAQPDMDKVMEKVNEMLVEDINATLEVRFVDWGELGAKYPMLLSSGEQVDLVFARSGWQEYASKGAFLAVEDLAKEYAPKTYKFLKENSAYYDGALVNDTLFMIPPNFVEVNINGVAIRGDIREKYNLPEIKSVDDYINYLRVVKENEPSFNILADAVDAIPFYGKETSWVGIAANWLMFDNAAGIDTLQFKFEIGEQVDFLKSVRAAYEEGLIQKDILMTQADSWVEFQEGTMASGLVNIKNFISAYGGIMANHPDWKIEFYDLSPNSKKVINPVTGGMAIPASAKYPEKAMQIIELFNTDERYWYLTTYGIEGVHYVNDNGVYKYAEGVSADNTGFAPDSFGWYWRDTTRMMPTENDWPEGKAMQLAIADNAAQSSILGFVFDPTSVEAEIATINALVNEYVKALNWGAVDLDTTLAELKKQAEAAGLQKVLDEITKQVKDFQAK